MFFHKFQNERGLLRFMIEKISFGIPEAILEVICKDYSFPQTYHKIVNISCLKQIKKIILKLKIRLYYIFRNTSRIPKLSTLFFVYNEWSVNSTGNPWYTAGINSTALTHIQSSHYTEAKVSRTYVIPLQQGIRVTNGWMDGWIVFLSL